MAIVQTHPYLTIFYAEKDFAEAESVSWGEEGVIIFQEV